MKTNRKHLGTQRRILDNKLKDWIYLKDQTPPISGWIKAIRNALGITNKQLANKLSVDASVIPRLEKRETKGKVTLEILDRVAHAMGCKLIYALIPEHSDESLNIIVDKKAEQLARHLVEKTEHSMRLESQGSSGNEIEILNLAKELADKMDSRIWDFKNTDFGKLKK